MRLLIKKNKELIFIFLLTLVGGCFRFFNLNWDSGYSFHPYERNIANAVSQIKFFSQLNPHFFAYGGLLIYLYRATGEIIAAITQDFSWIYDWGHINIIGRFYSALFSTLTLPSIYFLAKKIFNKRTAVIATSLAVFTVTFIQTSHFSITENFLIFISVLICLSSANVLKKSKLRDYILCGVLVGLAAAAKTTGILFLIFPLTAYFLSITKAPYKFLRRILYLFSLLITTLTTFTIFSPYTFLSWEKFMESMRYESGVALGTLPVPYTLQFTNTYSYLFQIKNFFWQLGPVSLLLVPSFILFLIAILKTKDKRFVLLLSFPLTYFLYVGDWHTKFIRFMLPTFPFIVITISYFLYKTQVKIKFLGNALTLLTLVITIFWAIAFFSIYINKQTRIAASEWIYENIPSNSKILGEHWDDGLPLGVEPFSQNIYNVEQLTIYEPDNEAKIDYYADKLSDADYIIINSRRLYGTLIDLPEKYPITSHYYKLLFNNSLGYKKIAEFSSYPSILGIEI